MKGRLYRSRSGVTFEVRETFVDANERRVFEVCRVVELESTQREYVLKIGGKPGGRLKEEVIPETDILCMFQHRPLIVQYVDHGWLEDGRPYLRTNYVKGENLVQLREGRGAPFAPEVVLAIVRDVSDALTSVHAEHILHCDIKLANIFLDYPHKRAILGDFHIACHTDDDGTTPRSAARGSAEVAAPEQYRDDPQTLDVTTDIYCLAVVVHDLLSSQRLFEGRSFRSSEDIRRLMENDEPKFLARTQKKQLRESLQTNTELNGQTLDAVAQLLCYCLKTDPCQRHVVRSARVFYERLAQALGLSADAKVGTWE